MFGWFKSERRERQKKIRQDRKHLEERVRRFLKGYLDADQVRKPEFYRAVEDISSFADGFGPRWALQCGRQS
jgi:hypothetical protein